MSNVVNNSNPNVYTKTNAVVVGTTGVLGTIGGVAKTHFIDKPDIQKGLEEEYRNYARNVALNEINIIDTFEREAKNKELKDKFNQLCDYCYNDGIKKINKKNIFFGMLIGITFGIAGVVAKNLLTKNKGTTNENSTNKVQYYNA